MLQIRLSKGSAADGGGGAAKSSVPVETVTVACPDHLILADLPVAKSLGAVTSSSAASVRSVGRRSRRNLGQKIHFCVCCDFPIAIYGRLIPCDHAFCLSCARSDSSCYLCDERIQKIQTIKMMEGIFVCAAPHCLKSFLKRSEFEAHLNDTHADLHQNAEKGGYETDAMNTTRQSPADPHKQSLPPESSTAHAPPRPGFSPTSSFQAQDREERPRRHQSRDQPPPRPLQPRPPLYHNRLQHQLGDQQTDNYPPPHGSDRPSNWFHQSQNSESQPQPPNYPHPLNANQALVPPPFSYPPFLTDGSEPYYGLPLEMQQRLSEQGSVLGIPPASTAIQNFPDNAPRPWGMAIMGMPFPPIQLGQGFADGFTTHGDPQGEVQFFQGGADYGRGPEGRPINYLLGKELEKQSSSTEHGDNKGVLAPLPLPLVTPLPFPPPPPPMPRPQQ